MFRIENKMEVRIFVLKLKTFLQLKKTISLQTLKSFYDR